MTGHKLIPGERVKMGGDCLNCGRDPEDEGHDPNCVSTQ